MSPVFPRRDLSDHCLSKVSVPVKTGRIISTFPGRRFWLFRPCRANIKNLTKAQPIKPKNFRSRWRVLLIEDHGPLAEATAEFMRNKGLDVRIASTGREALETAAAFHPEIVMSDIMLPDMTGLEVARALRAMPGAKDAVIAMHSAMTESDLGPLSRQVSAVNLFLSKPITEEKLDTLISELKSQAKKKF